MADSTVRQRTKGEASKTSTNATKFTADVEDTSRVISVLDILRVLLTLIVAGLAVSYYITSGESLTYGYKPWFLNAREVKAWMRGPIHLTTQELAKYDGTNPDLPIYISVNGTIYDVTAGSRMYGPGGGYHVFAGRDASRSFVTGCFQEDTTHDMRGAEEVYLPIEDAPDENISSVDKENRAIRERKEAKERAHAELKSWVDFFSGSPKYPTVGKVIGLKEPAGPPPQLCSYAQKGRPKRSAIIAHKAAAAAEGQAST